MRKFTLLWKEEETAHLAPCKGKKIHITGPLKDLIPPNTLYLMDRHDSDVSPL